MPNRRKWWKKSKNALGLNHYSFRSRKVDDASPSDSPVAQAPDSSNGSVTSTFKDTCSICLNSMKHGDGHALFTAECSHTFHFHCISSSVKHGNRVCPVCRADWKEVNLQGLVSSHSAEILLPPPHLVTAADIQSHVTTPSNISSTRETFDDDEPVDPFPSPVNDQNKGNEFKERVEIKVYPEVPAVKRSVSQDDFAVLVHLRAPTVTTPNPRHGADSETSSAAPLDLVTVLDVSGSMAGPKLSLLKKAMEFVIKNLGSADRLSVVTFSSTARRVFHLRRMSELGRQLALQAVNDLSADDCTDIAKGLRKGAKVIEERKHKNPMCSIILLSDGQDNTRSCPLTPSSVRALEIHHIPIHTFGIGSDHDSNLLHAISEISGGTYSFIERPSVIQDAFAQCIGGLMSVVVQQLRVEVECVHPDVRINSIKAGSYTSCKAADNRSGSVRVGDLYEEEERDFLVSVNIPAGPTMSDESEDVRLLKVRCFYANPTTKENVNLEEVEVTIRRPEEILVEPVLSVEVDRQKMRLKSTEAMTEAKEAAERGLLSEAVEILQKAKKSLAESMSMKSGDSLCESIDEQLRQLQEKMVSQKTYVTYGRAQMLSNISLYSTQRANICGSMNVMPIAFDAIDESSGCSGELFQSARAPPLRRRPLYQTLPMTHMLERSQR